MSTVDRQLAMLDRLLSVFGDRAFVVGGALLGLMREGRLLEHDNDFDMALHLRDWDERFLPQLRRAGIGFRKIRRWGDPPVWPWASRYVGRQVRGQPYILKITHDGFIGDVYIYAPGVGVHEQRLFMERARRALVYRPSAALSSTLPADLHGRPVRIPVGAEDLLTHCYGDWRTPVPGPWERSAGWEVLAKGRWIYEQTPVRVFTGGVFDMVHEGHRNFLSHAREYGNHLTVGILRDEAVTKPDLTHTAEQRAEHVRALGIADEVEIVGPLTREYLTERAPNVLAYGPEWDRPDARAWATVLGIAVVTIPRTPGISSSALKAAAR